MNYQYSNPFVPFSIPAAKPETAQPAQSIKSDFMDMQQAADYLGIAKGTLMAWRCHKTHEIPSYKIGRYVRYKKKDLDEWISKQRVAPEDWNDE